MKTLTEKIEEIGIEIKELKGSEYEIKCATKIREELGEDFLNSYYEEISEKIQNKEFVDSAYNAVQILFSANALEIIARNNQSFYTAGYKPLKNWNHGDIVKTLKSV